MKLYEVWVCNGLEYDDEFHFTKIVVAENKKEALNKVFETEDCYFKDYPSFKYQVTHLDIIDGYEIKLHNTNNKSCKVILDEKVLKD